MNYFRLILMVAFADLVASVVIAGESKIDKKAPVISEQEPI